MYLLIEQAIHRRRHHTILRFYME